MWTSENRALCDRCASRAILPKGEKRHILVDAQGLLMHAVIHAADIQDRDGGVLVMASLFRLTRMAAIRGRTGAT